MKPQPTVAVLALCLIAMLATSVPGQVQSTRRPISIIPADPLAAQPSLGRVHHYAILGPIGRPGVYASAHDDLTLAELVAAAGGTTPPAGNSAQVIRHGQRGPRLNDSLPATARLKPGDVVVLERSSAADAQEPDAWVPVALVGITPAKPVVVALPHSRAEVSQLISALKQKPALIDSVRILRPSPSPPQNGADQPITRLSNGDVVVFDPATIDCQALARAESFPPPVLIPERKQRGGEIIIRPQQSFSGGASDTVPIASHTAAQSSARVDGLPKEISPLPHEPGQGSEHSPRPPLALPNSPSSPLTAANHPPAGQEDAALVELTDEAEDLQAIGQPEQVVAASLASALPKTPQSSRAGVAATVWEPERMTTSQGDTASAFAGNGPQQPEFRTAATDFAAGIAQVGTRRADVAAPSDPAARRDPPGFGMRALTVGITVLATALICFAASLLWSRLDDSTGLPGAVAAQRPEQLPIHSQTARGDTLNRLINNELPIIEEPMLLPEGTDFHGEAVGRRRLRIDAEQTLSEPHFAAPQQTSRPVAVPAISGTANTRPNREDSSAETPSADAGASSTRETAQGGLLDRVLVAMERERRR